LELELGINWQLNAAFKSGYVEPELKLDLICKTGTRRRKIFKNQTRTGT
jgi:hypothetical protein